MIKLEALNAKYGDALLLHFKNDGPQRFWIIDGGPRGTWNTYLRPRLKDIKGDNDRLTVDLAMLSHVDEDHVSGMLQLAKNEAEGDAFLDIRRFWHNSFADLADSEEATAALAGMQGTAQAALASDDPTLDINGEHLDHRAVAVLASVNQGRDLRDYIETLALSGNQPFGGTLSSGSGARPIDEAKVTIVGPIASRLEVFREHWAAAAGNAAALAGLFRDDLDESPTNLSSVVVLVEIGERKLLFTGDARGDDILDGFQAANLGGRLPMTLDVLKMPHHGSDRNMTQAFLRSFPAKHYVISADGKYGNPDRNTLKAIVQERGNDAYKIWLTNKVAGLPQLLQSLSEGKNFEYEFRDPDASAIAIEID
jgi:hypothetical protein